MSNDQYTQLFKYMETQFSAIREDSAQQTEEIRRLGTRMGSLEGKVDQLDDRLERVEQRLTEHDERFDALEEGQQEILNAIGEAMVRQDKELAKHDHWIHQLADSTDTNLQSAA